jgi:protoporphyrinogen oxidase/AcrR family transcriptional regulator
MRETTVKKRQFVIDTAIRLFTERGYEQVTVDDIIAEAGISKGTFYHYFKGKDEIVRDIGQRQMERIEEWQKETPSKVQSVEGHINRLFLNLAADIKEHPRFVRSLLTLGLQNEEIRKIQVQQLQSLHQALQKWLPNPKKAEALVSAYMGTVMIWSLTENGDLEQMTRDRLAQVWNGLKFADDRLGITVASLGGGPAYRTAVVGGGLAGLTAAAYLAKSPQIEGILFERSPQLGGRAFTYEKAGFTLNYGAHAVYGIDRHTLSRMRTELGLSFSSKQVDKRKVMYLKHNRLTPAPLDFVNIVQTHLLDAKEKIRFVGEVAATIANIHHLKRFETLGDYLAASHADENVKELWEHLVCSNFFIAPEDARKVPGPAISEYYHNLFLSARPVNYILGSWAVLTNQLKAKIEESGRWQLALKEGVEEVRYENGKYMLRTKTREEAFDRVIFAMPVQQVAKLLSGTAWEPFMKKYENNTSTEVLVYDIGLHRVVARPFSYISDMDNKMFISDVSATDHTLVPEGGQLLQGVAYLHDEEFAGEEERKAYLDQRLAQMESLFDKYYPGWKEETAVKRVSKKAMVQSVKNIKGNRLLPVRMDHVPFYFCGDGCEGKGELAERAFSSAREAAKLLLAELEAAGSKPLVQGSVI